MSELVPGVDVWRTNVTAPSILDPANGTEIKTGLEHLADRTFYLGQYHPYREDLFQRDDAGYSAYQTISVFTFQNVSNFELTIPDTLLGDIVEVTSMVNYSTLLVGLLEVQHESGNDGAMIGRRQIAVVSGDNDSFIHTSYHKVIIPGILEIQTQVRIDAGDLILKGPAVTYAKLMRATS